MKSKDQLHFNWGYYLLNFTGSILFGIESVLDRWWGESNQSIRTPAMVPEKIRALGLRQRQEWSGEKFLVAGEMGTALLFAGLLYYLWQDLN